MVHGGTIGHPVVDLTFQFLKTDFTFDIRLHATCVETNSNLGIVRSLSEIWDLLATRPWLIADGWFSTA